MSEVCVYGGCESAIVFVVVYFASSFIIQPTKQEMLIESQIGTINETATKNLKTQLTH